MTNRYIVNAAMVVITFVAGSRGAAAQANAPSFSDLQALVRRGEQVIVRTMDGRNVSGQVVSLGPDGLELRRRRWNFRSDQQVFVESSIRRIEKRDSSWNGQVLGAGAGVLTAWIACRSIHDPDNWSCLAWMPIAPAAGSIIGGAIDSAVNRALYVAPQRSVTLRTAAGRGNAGLAVSVSF